MLVRMLVAALAMVVLVAALRVRMLLCMVVLAGCNTIAGAGKDVQKVGEKVEESSGK